MNRNHMAALALAALTLGACGRDATAPKGSLTEAEARDVAAAITSLSAGGALSASTPTSSISLSSGGVSWKSTVEVKCPAGGTLSADLDVTGSYDQAKKSGVIDVTGKQTLKDCANPAEGQTITMSGTSTSTAHLEISGGKPGTETLTQKGSFDWTKSDGTKGSCTVDLTGSFDPLTTKAAFTGTFCGHALH